jgi:hypothetical protein
MSKEILTFLYEIVEADGRIDEREMLALNSIKSIFNEPMHEIVRKDIKKGILDTRKIVRKGMANARKNLRGLF